MKLHDNSKLFKEVIAAVSAEYNYEDFQIEKDYYVSLLLKKLNVTIPDIVFKGGTSLSKCYQVIHRFSEDIDLNILYDEKVTNKQKTDLKQKILNTIRALDFKLLNDQTIPSQQLKSRMDFNKYLVGYDKSFTGNQHMINHIIIETNVYYKAYPYAELPVNNYITTYLEEQGEKQIIRDYDLLPFTMNVQTIDRTFIDKVFAICDYYEDQKSYRLSRHLYDLHMIWNSSFIQYSLIKATIPHIIDIRSKGKNTYSCKPGYPLVKTLNHIIDTQFYKADFNTNTKEFIAVDVEYETVINSITEIIDSGIFPNTIN